MEYVKGLIEELIDSDVILIEESKKNLLSYILYGLYNKGKSDYEKETRQEFKKKVEEVLNNI